MFTKWSLILFLILSAVVTSGVVKAEKLTADTVEGEEGDDIVVDSDYVKEDTSPTGDIEGETKSIKPHSDADTCFFITKPRLGLPGLSLELPTGKDVSFLVGFSNKGNDTFIVESLEASFRYALDFSYHLQNFSAIAYNRPVPPNEEATFAYAFFVSEAYSTRSYGFTVNLHYKDSQGNQYLTSVFNETVSIIELDEGLDGETFFLYILLTTFASLIIFSIYHYFFSSGKKRSFIQKTIETGTANQNGVDYNWVPKGHEQAIPKSPKAPRSPKQRKTTKAD